MARAGSPYHVAKSSLVWLERYGEMKTILKASMLLAAVLMTGPAASGQVLAGGDGAHRHKGHGQNQYHGGFKYQGRYHFGRKRHGGYKYGHRRYGGARRFKRNRHFGQFYFGYPYFYGPRRNFGRRGHYPRRYVPRYRTSYAQPPAQYVQPQVINFQPTGNQKRRVSSAAPLPPGCRMIREYQTRVDVGGKDVAAYGDSCLLADGSWKRGPAKIVPD